jgi:hypothetical protein
MGYFNETLYNHEHFSKTDRPEWQMKNFREVIEDCQLQDLGWSGTAYTWDNQQSGDQNVKARLDRVFANSAFLTRFEPTRVRHIASMEFDHCFVLAELRERLSNGTRGARQFRYENVWQTHLDYDEIFLQHWSRGSDQQGLLGITDALQRLQGKLSAWGAEEFGCLTRTVRNLRKKLDRLRVGSLGRGPSDEEKIVVKKLKRALHQEEIWMKQCSRVQWLREGDRNNSYFHKQAAQRRRMNKTEFLQRADGSVCENMEDTHVETQGFYSGLYQSQGFRAMDELLDVVQPIVVRNK